MNGNLCKSRRSGRMAVTALLGLNAALAGAGTSVCRAGDPAPDFTLLNSYGQPISLHAYRGAVVFLSFGATW